jgi:hypothetical protein
VPLVGAAAVGAYAYWDTLQVARTARRLLEAPSVDAAETATAPPAGGGGAQRLRPVPGK